MSVDSCQISTAGKHKKWNYVERISKGIGENKDINIDLLIGANCLHTLEPIEVIPRQYNGLYTYGTALRWCVVGLFKAKNHS